MDFDDILAQAGSVRDLLVLLPGHDQGHDLPLTRGQGLEPRLQIGSKPDRFPPSTIAFDPSLDGIEKFLLVQAWSGTQSRRISLPVPRSHSALLLSPGSVGLLLSLGSAVLPTLAHVLRLTLDQAVLFLILVAVDLRTLAAVVLLHTLTVVGPLVSLATRVVLVALAATLHAMAYRHSGRYRYGRGYAHYGYGSGGGSYSDRNCY